MKNYKDDGFLEERAARQPSPMGGSESVSGVQAASFAIAAATSATTPDEKEYLEAPYLSRMSEMESVSLNDGSLQITETDFVLPGKNGFDLVMTRRYRSSMANMQEAWPYSDPEGRIIFRVRCLSIRMEDDDGNVEANVRKDCYLDSEKFSERRKAEEKKEYYDQNYTRGHVITNLKLYDIDGNTVKTYWGKWTVFSFGGTRVDPISTHAAGPSTKEREHKFWLDMYGLGYGWDLALPAIEVIKEDRGPNTRPTYSRFIHLADGRNFTIDINRHVSRYKMKDFEYDQGIKELQGPVSHHAKIKYKHGSTDYFKATVEDDGEYSAFTLVAREDKYGNLIKFDITPGGGMTITDTWGRTITLTKSGNTLTWKLPEGKEVVYHVDNDALSKVVKKVDSNNSQTTSYTYENQGPLETILYPIAPEEVSKTKAQIKYKNLTKITHPTGATTQYSYTGIKLRKSHENIGETYRNVYVLQDRKEIVDGQVYNIVSYEFEPYSGYMCIKTAKVTRSNRENKISYQEEHTFDDKSRCTGKKVFLGSDANSMMEVTYEYHQDSDNPKPHYYRPSSESCCYYNKSDRKLFITKTTAWEYDNKLNITKETVTDNNGYEQVTEYKYNDDDNQLNQKDYKKDSKTSVREKYEYTDKLLTSQETYEVVGNKETLRHKTEYEYTTKNGTKFLEKEKQHLVEDEAGTSFTTKYEYDSQYRTMQPQKITYEDVYDSSGDKLTESFKYDGLGRTTYHKDRSGNVTEFSYDGLGRILKEEYTVDGGKTEKTNAYNDTENSILKTDEIGNKVKYTYTKLGKISQVRDVTGGKLLTDYTYDNEERLKQQRDYDYNGKLRATTIYAYDNLGRETEKQITGGQVGYKETTEYDDANQGKYQRVLTTIEGGVGLQSFSQAIYRDIRDRVVMEGPVDMADRKDLDTNPLLTTYTHDIVGNRTSQVSPKPNGATIKPKTEWKYNLAGQVTEEKRYKSDNVSICRRDTYDSLGNKTESTDFKGKTSVFKYDALGRMVKKTIPMADGVNAVTQYGYDGNGNLTEQKVLCSLPGQPEQWRVTEYKYDKRGWLIDTIVYGEGGTESRTRNVYDKVGNKIAVYTGMTANSISGARKIAYTYDQFGNLLTETDPLGRVQRFTHDNNGLLLSKTDRRGNTTVCRYDALGNLISRSVSGPGGTDITTYTYGKNGKLLEEKNGVVTVSYTYDFRGNVTRIQELSSGVQLEKAYDYDDFGTRKGFYLERYTVPQDAPPRPTTGLSYTYDALGRLTTVSKNNGQVVAGYAYDDNGNRTELRYPTANGDTVTSYKYNYANLVTSLTTTKGGKTIHQCSYSYLPDGNQSGKTENGRTTSYTYDLMGRLAAERWADQSYSYAYDDNGNRESLVATGAEAYTTGYTYNGNNWLTQEKTVRGKEEETTLYRYDEDGNQVYRERDVLENAGASPKKSAGFRKNGDIPILELREYNGLGQLVQVNQDGTVSRYIYRPDGLRHSKTGGGKTTIHHWDGQDIVAEEANGAIIARYHRGIGLLAREQDGALQFYLHNAHGDVAGRLDGWGNLLKRYVYDAFGNEEKPEPLDANPFRYCGEYYDRETGNVYLRARYYNPRLGRFMSEDSIGDGVNWYTYCGNNPIRFVDPTGLILTDKDAEDFGTDSVTYTSLNSLHINWEVADKQTKKEIEKLAKKIRRISYDRLSANMSLIDIGIPSKIGEIKLNSTERILLSELSKWELGYYAAAATNAKIDTTILFSGPILADDVEGNAFQHALWNFRLIESFGFERAKLYTDAHEYGTIDTRGNLPTYGDMSTIMDLKNNHKAMRLYSSYQEHLTSSESPMTAQHYILTELVAGQFWYINDDNKLVRTTGQTIRGLWKSYV